MDFFWSLFAENAEKDSSKSRDQPDKNKKEFKTIGTQTSCTEAKQEEKSNENEIKDVKQLNSKRKITLEIEDCGCPKKRRKTANSDKQESETKSKPKICKTTNKKEGTSRKNLQKTPMKKKTASKEMKECEELEEERETGDCLTILPLKKTSTSEEYTITIPKSECYDKETRVILKQCDSEREKKSRTKSRRNNSKEKKRNYENKTLL
ncbi:uncharacterized protein LOC111617027 [Centruroides sculpturatus]|uniref:uncharacterized protein LOC111617027 n=1 Tax=Centruroides sculpturatus TaxID=218467 RepID=UPI000C6E30F1|nr:uncharacterized protein LOC111617027 [Centruroides sculpturatus]